MPDTARRLLAETLWMVAGLAVWAAHLALVYGITAIACARKAPAPVLPSVAVATAVAAAVAAGLTVRAVRRWRAAPPDARVVPFVAVAGAGLAVVAILWGGLPAIFVPGCS